MANKRSEKCDFSFCLSNRGGKFPKFNYISVYLVYIVASVNYQIQGLTYLNTVRSVSVEENVKFMLNLDS